MTKPASTPPAVTPPVIIAVDGPAGAGKGTLARALAERFGYAYLDSGLLYRAVGDKILRSGGDPTDPDAAAVIARSLCESDLAAPSLRDEAVARAASQIASVPAVRTALLDYQHAFARAPRLPAGRPAAGAVIDGRDIGSAVFPDATVKFYVTASIEARAERRLKELRQRGAESIYARVLRDMRERDDRDRGRSVAPLARAPDAYEIDSTALDAEAVLRVAMRRLSFLGLTPPPARE